MFKNHIQLFIILVLTLAVAACGKNKVIAPQPDPCENYYGMTAYDVGVNPQIRQVQILYQVTDCKGIGVNDLVEEDFEVIENDFAMDTEADIQIDPGQIPFSIRTVLLLDISRSVEPLIGQVKEACIALIEDKLPNQSIAVYAFDKDLYQIQDFTTNTQTLVSAVQSLPDSNLQNSTNLYGAIIDLGVPTLWNEVFTVKNIEDGNLIVFTDGRHNANQTQTIDDAVQALGGRRCYVVALESPDLVEEPLKKLAETGAYYYVANVDALKAGFLEIQERIISLSGSIYYLFYTSPITDPTPHENELRLRIRGNTNKGIDAEIVETFNSAGFN